MNLLTTTLKNRIKHSNVLINKARRAIIKNSAIKKLKEVCIYATGSYAREEAWKKSDLDIFFINTNQNSEPVSKLEKILSDAELIKLNKKLHLPDFSNDGQFLEIHHLKDIIDIGSQEEDYKNSFTARMLFLLESKVIYNSKAYEMVLESIIDAYFRDFHQHEKDFKPVFLVNDIVRYWKTLCLNYEHKRNRRKKADEEKKLKAHKNNLKLKFSRKLTCFSFLLGIVSHHKNYFDKESIKEIVQLTPVQRLELVASKNSESLKNQIKNTLVLYSEFLAFANKPDKWLLDKENRDFAFDKSRIFGDRIFKILLELTKENQSDILKYFVS